MPLVLQRALCFSSPAFHCQRRQRCSFGSAMPKKDRSLEEEVEGGMEEPSASQPLLANDQDEQEEVRRPPGGSRAAAGGREGLWQQLPPRPAAPPLPARQPARPRPLAHLPRPRARAMPRHPRSNSWPGCPSTSLRWTGPRRKGRRTSERPAPLRLHRARCCAPPPSPPAGGLPNRQIRSPRPTTPQPAPFSI